ncbi:MAG: hypothetical protein JXB04_04335 [Kiritimatiellae bacterium]|nr:hypothetical protein [Kiritimatiellia bacterium]
MIMRRQQSKRGIALVIVLGLLSVILMLAASFAVSMRTERLTARNYVDAVKARYLVRVGLTRAIHAADQDIDLSVYPDWPDSSLASDGSAWCDDLLAGIAEDYLPGSVLLDAQAAATTSVRWTNALDPDGVVIGRYAYLVVDCSGFVDANWIHGQTRSYGTNTMEITLDQTILPEVGGSPDNLPTSRAEWKRFESLPELYYLGASRSILQAWPENLFIYSFAPCTQYLDSAGSVEPQVYIGGSEAAVRGKRQDIVTAFTKMGVDPAQVEILYRNLVDYVDADNEPGAGSGVYNTFCTERVPMINEVEIGNNRGLVRPQGESPAVEDSVDVKVELWYPFTTPSADTFSLEVTFIMGRVFGPLPAQTIPLPAGVGVPDAVSGPYPMTFVGTRADSQPYPSANEWPTEYGIRIDVKNGGGVTVDRLDLAIDNQRDGFIVPGDWPASRPVPPDLAQDVGPKPAAPFSKECNDPRINWAWDNPDQWDGTTVPSPGNKNNKAQTGWSAAGKDGTGRMYVRDDSLPCVGEMAFLLYDEDKPWETLPILGPGAKPVLTYFTVTTNEFQKGLVNPNSRSAEAIASVLMDCPVGFPESEEGALDETAALAIATAITNVSSAATFLNLGDLADVSPTAVEDALSNVSDLTAVSGEKQSKESFLRNSAGLLSTRQNLFTIFVAAQTVRDLNNNGSVTSDEVFAEQRAVAVVWRDPFPDEDGYHPAFVRFFKWLYE